MFNTSSQRPGSFFGRNRLLIALFLLPCQSLLAQEPEVFKEKGYTLNFINQDPQLDPALKKRLIKTFFDVYPTLVKAYNKASIKEVTFFVDTAYTGVAEAGGGRVRFSANWFRKKPGDIDVVTHEVMHIVQSYPDNAGPWWVTEGVADYVRYTYGVDNAGAGWSMPAYKPEQNYENSYRITARFLVWIEQKKNKGFVKALDKAMRSKTYTDGIWKQLTGSSIEELWNEYAEDPTIG